MANEISQIDIRLECLRLAVEFGTQRDMLHPSKLADIYYEWVMQGSSETSPQDNRKDDSLKLAQKTRSVRKG
tara:strand:- start:2399 stop:2614 length:216 start_codon:yes stop_codon:yes gene_type:complete